MHIRVRYNVFFVVVDHIGLSFFLVDCGTKLSDWKSLVGRRAEENSWVLKQLIRRVRLWAECLYVNFSSKNYSAHHLQPSNLPTLHYCILQMDCLTDLSVNPGQLKLLIKIAPLMECAVAELRLVRTIQQQSNHIFWLNTHIYPIFVCELKQYWAPR